MAKTTRTTTTKSGLFGRKRTTTTKTSTNPLTGNTTVTQTHHGAPGHHGTHGHHGGVTTSNGIPRRKVTMGDKVSGAMMKLRGTLTRRPGLKAAGTRRMHGTDGLGTHRGY